MGSLSFLKDWIVFTYNLAAVIILNFYKFSVVSEYYFLHKMYRRLLATLKVSET